MPRSVSLTALQNASMTRLSGIARLIFLLALVFLLASCGRWGKREDPLETMPLESLYADAKEALESGNVTRAQRYYQRLIARFPYGPYTEQAQIELAYAYFKGNKPEDATSSISRFVRTYPAHPYIDYMYYLRGLINFNEDLGVLGQISQQDMTERDPKGARESFESFRELITRFPDSKYTPDAVMRMKYLVNALVSLEVHVARYYMKRGAYLAAINRAQYAVKTYPDAPATEEALFIMVKAYDQLGMSDMRDDSERIMRKNFPNSVYYTRGLEREVPWWKLW